MEPKCRVLGVPAALGKGGGEGLSVFTWEEIKAQLWEVSSALGKRLEGRDEASAADKASEQFPTLRESRARGEQGEVSAWRGAGCAWGAG